MPAKWGLLTNHALVLIHVVEHPRSTLRDIADSAGITERATLSLLKGLEEDNIVYVATTRAKHHLTRVTGVPSLAR